MSNKLLSVRRGPIAAGLIAAAFALSGCDMDRTATSSAKPAGQGASVDHALSAVEPAAAGGPIIIRRLTEDQYRQSIADIFGADVKIAGRFDPDNRTDGLLAIGTSKATVLPSGFEQYEKMARLISAQAVDEAHRAKVLGCSPGDAKAADDKCATAALTRIGLLVYRRPLSKLELSDKVKLAHTVATARTDFYAGMQYALSSLLVSPHFIFRDELQEADAKSRGRLDAYSRASQISFLIWNTTPDAELLEAAARGELNTKAGLARQVDRLLASPRLEAGVRAFFADFLGFEAFESLAKDPMIYPKSSPRVAADAKEQTLRTVVDELITRHGDYRDLFTTRRTQITRTLGMVYRIPVASDGWQPYEFAADDPRAGLLTQLSFVALHSHPGRSSPTIRGKALRELIMCQKVPDPPANVDFSKFEDTFNPTLKTARERLKSHAVEAMCTGCHKITDPIGLALENFDGLGQLRTTENGAPINAGGALNGIAFDNPEGLGKAVHDDPAVPSCLVRQMYKYTVGREILAEEREWMSWLDKGFQTSGYRVPELLRHIALSDGVYAISMPPETKPTESKPAEPLPSRSDPDVEV